MVFADTAYFVALISDEDDLHARALEAARRPECQRLLTTEGVLTEVLSGFAARGRYLRMKAHAFVRALLLDPNVNVVWQGRPAFEKSLERYGRRPDQGWSLVDCGAMLAME